MYSIAVGVPSGAGGLGSELTISSTASARGRVRPFFARLISTAFSILSRSAHRFQSRITLSKPAPIDASVCCSLSITVWTCASPSQGADCSPAAAVSEKSARSAGPATTYPGTYGMKYSLSPAVYTAPSTESNCDWRSIRMVVGVDPSGTPSSPNIANVSSRKRRSDTLPPVSKVPRTWAWSRPCSAHANGVTPDATLAFTKKPSPLLLTQCSSCALRRTARTAPGGTSKGNVFSVTAASTMDRMVAML
mmetsp:Transcript_101826/g.270926  ORF Transcript_101826/g.270926 Transcript_101826/m.270926 type:complete len:249 (+) Transcript_101826:250-996(+)